MSHRPIASVEPAWRLIALRYAGQAVVHDRAERWVARTHGAR
jgi:hypothetical protein